MRFILLVVAAAAALLGLSIGPTYAQATRTWVSGVGDDANPCSRTAPCKTFAGAISKTSTGGEINCLDPAGFGALTITKSITILCDGVSNGGVLVQGTNGIVVNLPAATNRVVLSGLDFEGASLSPFSAGLSGVLVNGLGEVIIRNSTIRDFSVAGVNLQGQMGTPNTSVVVQNSMLSNNGVGVNVLGVSGATNKAEVLGTLVDGNTTGLSVGAGGVLVLSASVLTGPQTGISVVNGGQVISYGNNVLRNVGTPPTSTNPLQ